MTDAFGWDAAFCPDPPPTVINGVRQSYAGFYIGGSSAFHVWTGDERLRLDEAGEQSGLLVMPIWVPTPGSDNPRQVALQAAEALRSAGYPAYARPWYRPLMWDLETGLEPDPGWMSVAAGTLHRYGYDSLLYGSVDGSRIFSEPLGPGFGGYIVAHFDGVPALYPHAGVVGKQYAAGVPVPGGQVDLNVVERSLLAHLGPVVG